MPRKPDDPSPFPNAYRDGLGFWRCETCLPLQPCGCHAARPRKVPMRFFDDDKIGCYLDDIGHRVEKTKDGKETKVVDLTLRVQPFTPELAVALDPDVRALLFTMTDAAMKEKIEAIKFRLTCPKQQITVFHLPEAAEGQIVLMDVEITGTRARTEKGVDGFALIFYASFGPPSPEELEYVCNWHTTQRFLTFHPQQATLEFGRPEAREAAHA